MGFEDLKKKKNYLSLEEKITASLIMVFLLFLIIFLDNLKSTGFAVVLSPQANFSLGFGLWIVLIVLVGAWGYFKLRGFMRKIRKK
jgi:nitrate reductase gamma subunit